MNDSPVSTPVAEHHQEPSKDFIYGAAPPAIGTFLLAAVLAGFIDGPWGAVSAVIGGLLPTVALAVGPLVMHWARDASPIGVLSRALASYVVVVVALGVAYVLLDDVEQIDGMWVGIAVLASTAAWLGGQYRTLRRLRLPVFELGVPFEDDPHDEQDDEDDAAPDEAVGLALDRVTDSAADRTADPAPESAVRPASPVRPADGQ